MILDILLDAGPLGLVTNPRATPQAQRANRWLEAAIERRHRIWVPAIADYEVRRELVRAGKPRSVERLDLLIRELRYLSITFRTMRRAAHDWALARSLGIPTAEDASLDADMILAAQAQRLARGHRSVVVATTNVRHLAAFCDARRWSEIS